MFRNAKKKCCNGKRANIDINLIIPIFFVLLGLVFIVWWMPVWIWFVFIGIILIIMGIKNL